MIYFFCFTTKNDFTSLFRRIWIKVHFPLKGPVNYYSKSLLRSFTDVRVSCTSENKEGSCHTLSNAFDISKKTLLTSSPTSKDLYVSWVIDNSWLMQELPGFDKISLFSIKKLNILLNSNLSRIFLQIGNNDTERYFPSVFCVSFFVNGNNITLSPFRRKNISVNGLLEYHFHRFVDGRTTYF